MHKSAMRSAIPAVFAVLPSNYQRAGCRMPRQSSVVGVWGAGKNSETPAVLPLFPAIPNSSCRKCRDGAGCLCFLSGWVRVLL
jgi:hypothetical protein